MGRILTILLLLAILAAAGWTLFNWERRSTANSDPWNAIPQHTAIIISVPEAWSAWDRFTHTSQLWGAFEQIPTFAAAGRLMSNTVERMQNDAALRGALENAPVLVCLLHAGSNELGGLFIGSPQGDAGTPMTAFSELLGLDATAINALSRGEVVQVRPDTALPALSLCSYDRLWLIATSAQVMDEAILQLRSGTSILQDSTLQQVKGTIGGGADAHVMIDLRRSARLLDMWVDGELLNGSTIPAGWAALDLRARPDAMLLSGLFAPTGQDGHLQDLRAQGQGVVDVRRMLPASVSVMESRHINDPDRILQDLDPGAENGDPARAMFQWVQGTMGRAWAQGEEGKKLQWAYFQAGDPEDALASLTGLCDPAVTCEQQEYRGNVLQRPPFTTALSKLLGASSGEFDRWWWTILGDVVLWSPTPEALHASIDAWHDGNSLAVEPRSSAWQQRISNTSGRMFWLDLARSRTLVRSVLRTRSQPTWDQMEKFLEQIGGISVQISPGNRGYYHVVAGMQHAPMEQRSNGVLWETEIGALVEERPRIVRNHNNNTNEVLVQDVEHKLHLIGSTGKLLWSRQLDGPIMGQVHQVDKFRNGKLQMLFNTAGRLHLIDRNGKDLGGFPVALREHAAVPISVFDYENERDYRVIIATTEGRILNFGLDGTEVKGWEKPIYGATVACPVQHLRIKNKDYLIFADITGQVHILDRRGMVRERTALNLGPSPGFDRILPGMDIMSSTIIWRDTTGTMQQGSLNGPVTALSTPGVQGAYSTVDMDGDGSFELVRLHGDTLDITREGQPVFMRTFGGVLHSELLVHSLSARKKALSVLHVNSGKVSLLDDTGRDLRGLPVAGVAPPALADLNLDDIPELITSTRTGKVVAYSLNTL